jgi:hypothetical protein
VPFMQDMMRLCGDIHRLESNQIETRET